VIVVGTSGLLAALDASENHHRAAVDALRGAGEPRLLSPFVLAELDHLLSTRVSSRVARAFLREVADGAYQLEPFTADDLARAIELLDRYDDLGLGLTDGSLIVLAERHGADDLLTLDEGHFRAVRGPRGRPFRLLPADARIG
jgi:predicted nucleic acid-binding protein